MTDTTATVLPLPEAERRIRADHELLLAATAGLTEAELAARYQVAARPLGDGCDSLHDLVAHVLMWDEISLAVLTEAAAGRVHWSLDPRWETAGAGRSLNRGGVAAGRHLPGGLLLHRCQAVHAAVLAELRRCGEGGWAAAGGGTGALAQRVWTVPGQRAFWHAAVHLRQLPAAAPPAGELGTARQGRGDRTR